jgi:hypothetical protein
MVMAVRQISRLGRQSMLGLRANGKQTDIILPYCKTSTLKNAGRKGLTLSRNSWFSLPFCSENKKQEIHYRTFKSFQTRLFQLGILACFLFVASLLFGANLRVVYASEVISISTLADAIRLSEGNKNYGVLSIPCKTEAKCRQICINSIKNNLKRYETSSKEVDFITFMGKRWAPVGMGRNSNDPKNLNANWVRNTSSLYAKLLAQKERRLKKFNDNVNYKL